MKNIKKIIESINGVVKVEERAKARFYIVVEADEPEQFGIEISLIYPNNKDKNSLPNLWYKNGLTDRVLDSYICVQTYWVDEKGRSFMRYNPTVKNGKINFDYKFEVTEENVKRIVIDTIKTYKER